MMYRTSDREKNWLYVRCWFCWVFKNQNWILYLMHDIIHCFFLYLYINIIVKYWLLVFYDCRIHLVVHAVCTAACTGVPCVRSTGRWREGSQTMFSQKWLWWTLLPFKRWSLLIMMIRKILKPLQLTTMSTLIWRCILYKSSHC